MVSRELMDKSPFSSETSILGECCSRGNSGVELSSVYAWIHSPHWIIQWEVKFWCCLSFPYNNSSAPGKREWKRRLKNRSKYWMEFEVDWINRGTVCELLNVDMISWYPAVFLLVEFRENIEIVMVCLDIINSPLRWMHLKFPTTRSLRCKTGGLIHSRRDDSLTSLSCFARN